MRAFGGDFVCKSRPKSAGSWHLNFLACKLMPLIQDTIRSSCWASMGQLVMGVEHRNEKVDL